MNKRILTIPPKWRIEDLIDKNYYNNIDEVRGLNGNILANEKVSNEAIKIIEQDLLPNAFEGDNGKMLKKTLDCLYSRMEPSTVLHSLNVAYISKNLSEKYSLDTENMIKASLIHDAGKITIKPNILYDGINFEEISEEEKLRRYKKIDSHSAICEYVMENLINKVNDEENSNYNLYEIIPKKAIDIATVHHFPNFDIKDPNLSNKFKNILEKYPDESSLLLQVDVFESITSASRSYIKSKKNETQIKNIIDGNIDDMQLKFEEFSIDDSPSIYLSHSVISTMCRRGKELNHYNEQINTLLEEKNPLAL